MSDIITIQAQSREASKNSARDTRDLNRVPGVVYGKEFASQLISVDASDILKTYRKAGESTLIDMDLDGKTIKVLIHDMDVDPVRTVIRHVDFYVVNLKEKTTVNVPLIFVGESPAVKNHGAAFNKTVDHLEIRCLPTDIPHDIQVNIESLAKNHDHISVSDIDLDSSKFEVMHMNPDTVVCSVTVKGGTQEEEEASTEAAPAEAAA